MQIVCWWSGGITSAVACKLAIEMYGAENCVVIILDTGNEHEDTYRFLKDCEKWYGLPITKLKSDKYETIEDTWFKHLSLNTAKGAICSYMLKRRVREAWEKHNEYDHQVFGFEFEKKELNRAKALELNHPQTKPIFPLIDAELSKGDCLTMVHEAGIKVPAAYTMGYQNNNCLNTGCVQGGIGYWQKIRKDSPELYHKMSDVEHRITNLKGKPVTMLKDQSKKAKDSGLELVFLKKHPDYPEHKCLDDMKGRPVKPLKECNGFCGVNELNEISETQLELNWEK
jgi:3'-phosphoadenosine 5'-phosphosulfate sulfotransferase (PAPS reductase)/FAD synthetase